MNILYTIEIFNDHMTELQDYDNHYLYESYEKEVCVSLYRDVKYFLLNIKRMYDYAKFGHENYDFDHSYIYKHLQFKLTRMEKSFRLHGNTIHHYSYARQCRYLLKLLDVMLDDGEKVYASMYEKMDLKYGKWSFDWEDKEEEIIDGEKYHTLKDKYEKPELAEIRSKIFMRMRYRQAAYVREQKKQFFTLLEKWIDNLWD